MVLLRHEGGGFENVGGERIGVLGKLHKVGEELREFSVGSVAEIFVEAAQGFADLEGAVFGIGFFGKLRGMGEGKFGEPALEQEGGDVEGGAVLDVRFGSVVDGVHDGERLAGRAMG